MFLNIVSEWKEGGTPVIVLRVSQKVKEAIVSFKTFARNTKVRWYVNIKAFREVTPCRLVSSYRRFGRALCLG
jgi:hypothetical protein